MVRKFATEVQPFEDFFDHVGNTRSKNLLIYFVFSFQKLLFLDNKVKFIKTEFYKNYSTYM